MGNKLYPRSHHLVEKSMSYMLMMMHRLNSDETPWLETRVKCSYFNIKNESYLSNHFICKNKLRLFQNFGFKSFDIFYTSYVFPLRCTFVEAMEWEVTEDLEAIELEEIHNSIIQEAEYLRFEKSINRRLNKKRS